jgi:hypothetical protein
VGQEKLYETKQYVSMSILGHSIVSYNYERSLLNFKGFSLFGELGLGMGEFSDSDASVPRPATFAFNVWLPVQYSFGIIDLTASISPTFYKYGKLGFIDLNGVFGLRVNFTKNRNSSAPFLGVYYNNKIYRTISNPDEVYFFSPISFKLGLWF